MLYLGFNGQLRHMFLSLSIKTKALANPDVMLDKKKFSSAISPKKILSTSVSEKTYFTFDLSQAARFQPGLVELEAQKLFAKPLYPLDQLNINFQLNELSPAPSYCSGLTCQINLF